MFSIEHLANVRGNFFFYWILPALVPACTVQPKEPKRCAFLPSQHPSILKHSHSHFCSGSLPSSPSPTLPSFLPSTVEERLTVFIYKVHKGSGRVLEHEGSIATFFATCTGEHGNTSINITGKNSPRGCLSAWHMTNLCVSGTCLSLDYKNHYSILLKIITTLEWPSSADPVILAPYSPPFPSRVVLLNYG